MNLSGKRIVVMGLGQFGGGVGVTRFLVRQGAHVLVTDLAPARQLKDSLAKLADLPVEFRLGEHESSDLRRADLIVVNPAVDQRDNPFLLAAITAGIETSSEICLLIQNLPNRDRTIGVTGTAGKSTVTAMIGHILSGILGDAHVHVGGNLGGSLLERLEAIDEHDWVVLELSSFMLEGLADERWSPHIAVITNFSPNHLDRYNTVEAYQQAKQSIFDYQDPDHDIAILGSGIREHFHIKAKQVRDWDELDASEPLPLSVPGRHNQINALLAAATIEQTLDIRWQEAAKGLEDFSGLPHRLQAVIEHGQVQYFNDSKSTTPEATKRAVESFGEGTVHLIVGGYDKGADLTDIARVAASRCRVTYTIGATGQVIADAAQGAGAEVVRCETVERAVAESVSHVRPGDAVLLSPGCASWDQFDNFEKRGAAFVEAVLRYAGE